VDGACGTHGKGQKSVQSFGGKARRRGLTEDRDVDGRKISEWISGRLAGEWRGGMESVGSRGAGRELCESDHKPSDPGATELVNLLFSDEPKMVRFNVRCGLLEKCTTEMKKERRKWALRRKGVFCIQTCNTNF
jgi:hypothetical protein